MKPTSYSDPNRLADVMALIQVLAQAEYARRSEKGLTAQLQGTPKSATTWTSLAEGHREFFRVRLPDAEKPEASLALISRHVLPKDAQGVRKPLTPEVTAKLLEIAISLHDREVTRKQRFITMLTTFIPIGVAIIAGLFAIAVALLQIAHPAPK